MISATPLLKVEHLQKSYGSRPVLQDVSFAIYPGEVLGLLGANGAGKTTAFYLTIGLLRQDGGKIIFHGQEVQNKPVHERALLGMGYLAQEPSVFRLLTVEENLLCMMEISKATRYLGKKEKKRALEELLAELHLEPHAKKKASMLSGGERRRLEITRALISQPSLLLLDEPFANIDPLTIDDVKKMILFLKKKGISVLITDHNAKEIFSIVDKSLLLQNGSVIAEGTTEEILANPTARACYLGMDFKL